MYFCERLLWPPPPVLPWRSLNKTRLCPSKPPQASAPPTSPSPWDSPSTRPQWTGAPARVFRNGKRIRKSAVSRRCRKAMGPRPRGPESWPTMGSSSWRWLRGTWSAPEFMSANEGNYKVPLQFSSASCAVDHILLVSFSFTCRQFCVQLKNQVNKRIADMCYPQKSYDVER